MHNKCRDAHETVASEQALDLAFRGEASTSLQLFDALRLHPSTDEAIGMKTSRGRWIDNRYPLIEAGMSKWGCLDWWAARYDRPLEAAQRLHTSRMAGRPAQLPPVPVNSRNTRGRCS